MTFWWWVGYAFVISLGVAAVILTVACCMRSSQISRREDELTFVKAMGFDLKGGAYSQWVINLYRYTPSLGISTTKGMFVPNFCPMCGEDFREEEDES